MITDVIVTWPRNCDYPLWRQFIRDNRGRFNDVIIAMHNSNTAMDYSEFIKGALSEDDVQIFNAPEPRAGIDDWRDLSVNASLFKSHADWVWFTEQDFYPRDEFWDEVKKHEDAGCDVIAVYQSTRMHPCSIFVKRSVLDKTRKKFGIVPDVADHFYLFQKDIEEFGFKVGKIPPYTYHHYNGLSQNWYLASIGEQPNYHIDEFLQWLMRSLEVRVPLDTRFTQIALAVIDKNCPPEVAREVAKALPHHSPTP